MSPPRPCGAIWAPGEPQAAAEGLSCPLGGSQQLDFFPGEEYAVEDLDDGWTWPVRIETVWPRKEFL